MSQTSISTVLNSAQSLETLDNAIGDKMIKVYKGYEERTTLLLLADNIIVYKTQATTAML